MNPFESLAETKLKMAQDNVCSKTTVGLPRGVPLHESMAVAGFRADILQLFNHIGTGHPLEHWPEALETWKVLSRGHSGILP